MNTLNIDKFFADFKAGWEKIHPISAYAAKPTKPSFKKIMELMNKQDPKAGVMLDSYTRIHNRITSIRNRIRPTVKSQTAKLNSPGIYFLKSLNGEVVYVGKSINLSRRIFQSLMDKMETQLSPDTTPFFFSYIKTKTVADSNTLEVYYISYLRPRLNLDCCEDEITVQITHQYKESKNFPIFKKGTTHDFLSSLLLTPNPINHDS